MADKTLNARIVQKHDIEAHWQLAENFVPKLGEVIVYDPDENCSYSRIKVGDGVTLVNSLPFSTPTAENIETALGYVPAEMPKYEQPDWGAEQGETVEVYSGTLLQSNILEDEGWAVAPHIELVAGKTYLVTWNGTEYECVAGVFGDNMLTCIGNLSLAGEEGDTGEPFIIASYPPTAMDATLIIPSNKTEDAVLTIVEQKVIIHQIPAEYIEPDPKNTITITVAEDDETVTCDTSFETAWAMEPHELAEAVKVVFEGSFGAMTDGAIVSVRDINKGTNFFGYPWIRIAVCPPEDTSEEFSIPTVIYINWVSM